MGTKTAVLFEIECDYPDCLNRFGERIIASSVFMAEEEAIRRGWKRLALDPRTRVSGWCCPYCVMEIERRKETAK